MLPKKNRLNKDEIKLLFQKSYFLSSGNLNFKFLKTKNNITKIGFITPKNIYKSSVLRNSLRRSGYNIVRKYLLTLPQGLMGVFVFNKKESTDLTNEIKNIINKIY